MKIVENDGIIANLPQGLLLAKWDISEKTGNDCWNMVAVGDIGLSGKIGLHINHTGNSRKIFSDIEPIIKNADCAFGNLETPLVDDWSVNSNYFIGNSQWAPGLAEVGFDVLHLASNHMLDFGSKGFAQTISSVRKAGISVIGAGDSPQQAMQLVIQNIRDTRVGWLAAGHTDLKQPDTPRLWELDIDQFLEETRRAKREVDILIVSLHWGPMLCDYPYIKQYHAAHQLVDNGASAVIMHHAHILQPVEIYKGVPICYGLGNCIFDITEGAYQKAKTFTYYKYHENQTSALFYFVWQNNKCISLSAIPFCLPEPAEMYTNSFRIYWPDKNTALQILERLGKISEDIKSDFSAKLQSQLQTIWTRELTINLRLIFRHGQLWRIWYLIRRSLKARNFLALFKICIRYLKGDNQ